MQFKHPEILYALFLLLIPIIVHLFQLRKFEKVAFTNVQFLKKIELQTRKSSKLKKFLILITRLLLFTALIFAFAQPYFSKISKNNSQDTYIYLDNSLSMQANGKQGELLKRAVQDIIETNDNIPNISLITNNGKWLNLSAQELKNQLLSLEYFPIERDLKSVLFELKNSFKKDKSISNSIFLVSDFQSTKNLETETLLDTNSTYNFVQLTPVNINNISLDSVYISSQDSENVTLKVLVNSHNTSEKELPISLYNELILLGKATVDINANSSIEVPFTIPFTTTNNGKITIEDSSLDFDNDLYFSLHKNDYINVLSIGSKNEFLEKIYTNDEFNLSSVKLNELDYGQLNSQNLIILNELETVPTSLTNSLVESLKLGNDLAIIPNVNSNLNTYNNLFKTLKLGSVSEHIKTNLNINTINFAHPFLQNVFENKIENFQYPSVQSYMRYTLKNSSAILKFENENPFVSQISSENGNVYVFSSAISEENSNFKNSPLIVPIFYNFGKYSYQHTQLNYTIGKTNELEINAELQKDDILQITSEEGSFIPMQRVGNNSVKITTKELPLKSGSYSIQNEEKVYRNISYNYDRQESNLEYADLQEILKNKPNTNYFTSVKEAFNTINNVYKNNNFWQLFLLAALLFLTIEVLILKFFKP